MRKLRRISLFALAAVLLVLSLAPALAPVASAESAEAPTEAAAEESPVYGDYTMIWISLLIFLICILLAAAIFFFTGSN